MFTVYALHSPASDKLYIGFTSELPQRLLSHNELSKKGFTVKYRPWVLFYTENFEMKGDTHCTVLHPTSLHWLYPSDLLQKLFVSLISANRDGGSTPRYVLKPDD